MYCVRTTSLQQSHSRTCLAHAVAFSSCRLRRPHRPGPYPCHTADWAWFSVAMQCRCSAAQRSASCKLELDLEETRILYCGN